MPYPCLFHSQVVLPYATLQYLNPNYSLPTSHQIFEGIDQGQASTFLFSRAMLGSVSDALGVPASAITISPVDERTNKRSLLFFIRTSSTISVTSGMTSSVVLEKLRQYISQGSFLTSMQVKSGLPIISMSITTLTDTTPITQSVSEPTASPVSKKGKSQIVCDSLLLCLHLLILSCLLLVIYLSRLATLLSHSRAVISCTPYLTFYVIFANFVSCNFIDAFLSYF